MQTPRIFVKYMDTDTVPSTTSINGLILAGGESRRMGFDKGLVNYHGLAQREYLFHLLSSFTTQTYISCRPGQINESEIPLMEDQHPGLGPFGAILTAFNRAPNVAWFVIACDFPLLDRPAMEQLIGERDPKGIATSFLDPQTLMPEPWISILEPKIFPILEDYHRRGKSSLRGILVDYNSTVIRAAHPDILLNANSPEEAEKLKHMIDLSR